MSLKIVRRLRIRKHWIKTVTTQSKTSGGVSQGTETTDNWNGSSDQHRKLLMLGKIKSIIQGQADLILTRWWRRIVRGVGSSGGPPLQPPTPPTHPPHPTPSVNCCLATRSTLAGLQAAVCCLWTHPGIRLLFAIPVRPALAAVAGVSTNEGLISTKIKPRKHLFRFSDPTLMSFYPPTRAWTSGHSLSRLEVIFKVYLPGVLFPSVSVEPSVSDTQFWCHAIVMQERCAYNK